MSSFPGLTHVAITVSDLAASTAWYTALFGSAPVLDEDEESGTFHHTVFALDGGMLFGLHTHPDSGAPARFDERQVGLDHIAFQCSPDALPGWVERLDALGIEHGASRRRTTSGISFRDPDNIALEFFAPPAPVSTS